MKRYALTAACIILAACSSGDTGETVEGDSTAAATPAVVSNDAAIRAAAEKYYQTMATGTPEAFDSLHHTAFVVVHGNGSVSNKEDRVAHHRAGRIKSTSVNNQILSVHEFGDDFALVHLKSTSQGESRGKAWGSASLVLGLARTGGGPWQVVYHQVVPETKPGT